MIEGLDQGAAVEDIQYIINRLEDLKIKKRKEGTGARFKDQAELR